MMNARVRRGFTTIELVTTLVVVAVLASIALASLSGIKTHTSFASATGEAVLAMKRSRAEALSRGVTTVFIVDTVNHRWWSIEAPIGTDVEAYLDTFDPAAPGTVIESGTLPPQIRFGPAAGYEVALAAPLVGIPMLSADTPNLPYCSFCTTGGPNSGFGAIVFQPGDRTEYSGAEPNKVGQAFTFAEIDPSSGAPLRRLAVAIVTQSGLITTFER